MLIGKDSSGWGDCDCVIVVFFEYVWFKFLLMRVGVLWDGFFLVVFVRDD